MKFLRRLQNPYLLVGQGFLLGAALFFATHPGTIEAATTIEMIQPAS